MLEDQVEVVRKQSSLGVSQLASSIHGHVSRNLYYRKFAASILQSKVISEIHFYDFSPNYRESPVCLNQILNIL